MGKTGQGVGVLGPGWAPQSACQSIELFISRDTAAKSLTNEGKTAVGGVPTSDVISIVHQAPSRFRRFPNIREAVRKGEVTYTIASPPSILLAEVLQLSLTKMASRATRHLTPIFRSSFRPSQIAFRAGGRRGMATTTSPSTGSSDMPWIVRALFHTPNFVTF